MFRMVLAAVLPLVLAAAATAQGPLRQFLHPPACPDGRCPTPAIAAAPTPVSVDAPGPAPAIFQGGPVRRVMTAAANAWQHRPKLFRRGNGCACSG